MLGDAFGTEGLDRVLEGERPPTSRLRWRIESTASLHTQLDQLARVRTEEGYMAEVKPDGNSGFLFIENHCPICAAATACGGFCSTELELFRAVLGPKVAIERLDHIVSGGRRCAYRITPLSNAAGGGRRTSRGNRSAT